MNKRTKLQKVILIQLHFPELLHNELFFAFYRYINAKKVVNITHL